MTGSSMSHTHLMIPHYLTQCESSSSFFRACNFPLSLFNHTLSWEWSWVKDESKRSERPDWPESGCRFEFALIVSAVKKLLLHLTGQCQWNRQQQELHQQQEAKRQLRGLCKNLSVVSFTQSVNCDRSECISDSLNCRCMQGHSIIHRRAEESFLSLSLSLSFSFFLSPYSPSPHLLLFLSPCCLLS